MRRRGCRGDGGRRLATASGAVVAPAPPRASADPPARLGATGAARNLDLPGCIVARLGRVQVAASRRVANSIRRGSSWPRAASAVQLVRHLPQRCGANGAGDAVAGRRGALARALALDAKGWARDCGRGHPSTARAARAARSPAPPGRSRSWRPASAGSAGGRRRARGRPGTRRRKVIATWEPKPAARCSA